MATTKLAAFGGILSRFRNDARGVTAPTFAVMMVPILGMAAGAIDYSGLYRDRGKLQQALDAAALAGTRELERSDADVRRVVRATLDANLPAAKRGLPVDIQILNDRSTVHLVARDSFEPRMLGIMGMSTMPYRVETEATIGTDEAEVVLALDVTGSMRANMDDLRTAASNLVNAIFMGRQESDRLRAALVPYVASVNVSSAGVNYMSWMDVNADARFHGQNFEGVFLGDNDPACNPPPPPPVVSNPRPTPISDPRPPSPPPPPPPPPPPRTSPDLGSLTPSVPQIIQEAAVDVARGVVGVAGRVASELVGIRSAAAASRHGMAYDAQRRATPQEAGYGPAPGVGVPVDCNRRTPAKVNHFHLFHAAGIEWRGCVEARPEPYDTSDTAPTTAIADTLFVPYFWPDERDRATWMGASHVRNDYWRSPARPARVRSWGDYENQAYVWKYWDRTLDKTNPTAFVRQDPNSGCPDPIVPLTNQRGRLDTAISALTSIGGSGTNSVEGLAWAWRVLSPGAPFTEGGRPDLRRRKIIVLMTDGMNEVVPQSNTWYNKSDYSAIGYADKRRLGSSDLGTITTRLDQKLATLCQRVKGRRNSADEIQIYTVLFDPSGGALPPSTRQIYRDCATTSEHFFEADSGGELVRAFETIARQISALRLSQ